MRFLALGDSYTIGEALPLSAGWPAQLARLLRDRGQPVDAPLVLARTGWTTDELAAGIDEAQPDGPFDFVSLLIGVNNQYRGRDVEEYRAEFRALLARAVAFAGDDAHRVIVLSIPDWGRTEFARAHDAERIAREIDRFNDVARMEVRAAGAHFVDITGATRALAADPAATAADGLHPSAATYARWAELVLPLAVSILAASSDA